MIQISNPDFVETTEVTLALAKGNAPFELLPGDDKNFGPADWAWQFLRLNTRYQESFEERDEATSSGYRNPFGLGKWLDPTKARLPRLGHGKNWFFPLQTACPSAECVDLPEPLVGRFGYSLAAHMQPLRPMRRAPYVWFAVDCSVPPDGQIAGMAACISAYKQIAQREGVIKGVEGGWAVVELEKCGWFDASDFERSAAGATESVHPSYFWRAVRIDILGPLITQMEYYSPRLKAVHEQLVKEDLVSPPPKTRLPRRDKKQENELSLTDGNWLKSLVVCAQLSQQGLTTTEIDQYLNRHTYTASASGVEKKANATAWDNWLAGRELRIARYIEEARTLVKGGYRWLIHAQKP